MYEVEFTPRARREFEKLTLASRERLADAIERLGGNPRPLGIRKLSGVLH